MQINKYAYKHEMAFEGKMGTDRKTYTQLDPKTY